MEEDKNLLPRWKFGGVYRNFQLPEIPLIPYKKRKTPKYLAIWRIQEAMKKNSKDEQSCLENICPKS
jgi:hypothetical protein